ncbi:MAG: HypC/HybG/HupF family hydrogenase formation chaperone [Arenicellales bacterium]|jgi:hydrogenase expression/formation protein HypC
MCVGIPAQIIGITDPGRSLGMVDIMGVRREVNLFCIAEPGRPLEDYVGEWVLVHVGFAMSRIDSAEAARTLALLEELGEAQETLSEMGSSA